MFDQISDFQNGNVLTGNGYCKTGRVDESLLSGVYAYLLSGDSREFEFGQ